MTTLHWTLAAVPGVCLIFAFVFFFASTVSLIRRDFDGASEYTDTAEIFCVFGAMGSLLFVVVKVLS